MSASGHNDNENMEATKSSPSWRRELFQWLFACVILSMVAWVCFFTAISAHTDISREKIYSELESHYFQDKAGARTFTYLGVFYLMLGALSLGALSMGITLPKPTHKMVGTSFQIPLVGGH